MSFNKMALTMDSVFENSDLAVNYLETYKSFEKWPATGKIWRINKYPDDIEESDLNKRFTPKPTNSVGSYVIRKLVQKLKEHKSMFFQLENVMKHTKKVDFESYFLLMCQYLECSEDCVIEINREHLTILMNEETPFCLLGCIAAGKKFEMEINVVCEEKMAPICHLFADICSQVGWNINLLFINEDDENDFCANVSYSPANCYNRNAVTFGCTGVVTESADIDSSLDAFIYSSATAPWKITRIFVQESVYDEVKESLAPRRTRHIEMQGCGEMYAVKRKLFVTDPLSWNSSVEPSDLDLDEGSIVTVEPYRTAKELRTLLGHTVALSVWAADSQAAHEAALAYSAPLVWLNDYASFHGPPASSLPVYEQFYSVFEYNSENESTRDLRQRWEQWTKLSKDKRIDSIMNVVQSLSAAPEGYDSVSDFKDEILKTRDDSFVSVEDGKMCLGVTRPLQSLDSVAIDRRQPAANLVIATINGAAAVYVKWIMDSRTVDLFASLEKSGVPVMSDEVYEPNIDISLKKLKVIRSNFGTIFAN